MESVRELITIAPPVYISRLNGRRWCKLNEVCVIVKELRNRGLANIDPTPEELVSRFASLAGFHGRYHGEKAFLFSENGDTELLTLVDRKSPPPYTPFILHIRAPYPEDLLVTEEWATLTLKAISWGAVASADLTELSEEYWQVGFKPQISPDKVEHITVDGVGPFFPPRFKPNHIPDCARL